MSAVISDMPDTSIRTKDIPNANPITRLARPGVLTPVLTIKASNAPNATIAPPTKERTRNAQGCAAFSTAMAATRSTMAPTLSGSNGSSVFWWLVVRGSTGYVSVGVTSCDIWGRLSTRGSGGENWNTLRQLGSTHPS
jgi:hypothetical protein